MFPRSGLVMRQNILQRNIRPGYSCKLTLAPVSEIVEGNCSDDNRRASYIRAASRKLLVDAFRHLATARLHLCRGFPGGSKANPAAHRFAWTAACGFISGACGNCFRFARRRLLPITILVLVRSFGCGFADSCLG